MSEGQPDGVPADEPIDVIKGDPAATSWRQAARRHQAEWRMARGLPVGLVTVPRTKAQKEAGLEARARTIGSRIAADHARANNSNFLNDAVVAAVEARLRSRQPHETLDTTRLYADLLSSMPMCFNLFGPLHGDPDSAAKVVAAWFPDVSISGAPVTVGFEWSPGRRDPAFLGDRTAFDAVFHIGEGRQHLIGVETKYHEHPMTERHTAGIPAAYRRVAQQARLFKRPGSVEDIWNSDLEQVWRDHLLALSCQQHEDGWKKTKYVLVAPAGNPAWKPLVQRYRDLLTDEAAQTVEYRSLESLLDAKVLSHADVFRRRYLPNEA